MRNRGIPYLKLIFRIIGGGIILFLMLNFLFPLKLAIPYSIIIVDKKNNIIHAFLASDQQWRMKTTLSEVSPLLKKTILQKEDKYFYYHIGFNPIAICRAFVNNLFQLKRTSGASTISMQVARMLAPKRRTYWAKLIEIFTAFQLESKFSKAEILQLYFNLLPFGSNIQGVKSASVLYFQKSPEQLSLAEVTALSIIPNRPSSLRIGISNERIVKERNKWLLRFKEEGIFSEKEIQDALYETLSATRHDAPQFAPHLSNRLKKTNQAIIHSTIDLNTQEKVSQMVTEYVQSITYKGIKNAAVLILDNQSHEVVAYIGSADFYKKDDGGQVDGIRAIRQPGSTLKPLLYGLCIDNGLLTPKTVLYDVPINIKGYSPENFDKKFYGAVSMDYALCNSLNIPAVKALHELGKEKMIDKLCLTNFNQIKKDKNKLGLSLILGGCGVTLEEMTALFSSFANQGQYFNTQFSKESILGKKETVLSPSANFMITEILSKVARPDLPINWEASQHTPRIAWKTGTSYGRKDAWSIGFNKKYTIGVWVGNFSGTGVADLSGANTATPLLFKLFNSIDYDSPNEWFAMPRECGLRQVCTETGWLPSEHCAFQAMDYFLPLVSSNKVCDLEKEFCLSANEEISYCKECVPATGYKKKFFKIIPPALQTYYDANQIPFLKVPPHNPDCERVFEEGAPQITSPKFGLEYFIDKNDPQPLALKCECGGDVKDVFWHIDNQFYRKCAANAKQFFLPKEGRIKISCTDDKGRNSNCWITVLYVKI